MMDEELGKGEGSNVERIKKFGFFFGDFFFGKRFRLVSTNMMP